MHHGFPYKLSDDLQGRATRRFMRYHLNWKVAVMGTLYVFLLFVLWAVGGPEIAVGLFAGAGMLLALLVIIAWGVRLRRGRALLAKLPSRDARCTIDDQGLHFENAMGTLNVPWAMLERVIRAPDVWLFSPSRYEAYPLPAAALEGEPGRFVSARVREAGGKVLDRR